MSLEPLLALTRSDVADYVNALFLVYIILIFIRVLLSWIPRMPYNRALHTVVEFVHQVTDPYLNLFRRFLPPLGGRGMAIDISPILAIIVLLVAQAVIVGAIDPG
ncbi:MAG: YggT family protein [Solirubrobacterales bacterium]